MRKGKAVMGRVVIGMDPHKRSATIEVMDEQEKVISKGSALNARATAICLQPGAGGPNGTGPLWDVWASGAS